MKKALVFAVMLVGLAVHAKRFGPNMQNMDWEKRFERTPDNAPPKWIFGTSPPFVRTPTGSFSFSGATVPVRPARLLPPPEPGPVVTRGRSLGHRFAMAMQDTFRVDLGTMSRRQQRSGAVRDVHAFMSR